MGMWRYSHSYKRALRIEIEMIKIVNGRRVWVVGEPQEYIYKTSIKKRPGWSEGAIRIFLVEPDKKKYNRYKRYGPKRCLYLRTRVVAVEQTEEFRRFVESNKVRVEAAKKSSEPNSKSYQSSQSVVLDGIHF